jgi:hypothetical protein
MDMIPDSSVQKALPYGVYDIGLNRGFVNAGTNHDTASFAAASIKGWWKYEGKRNYKNLKYIQITADGGGSNGHRPRIWKFELQKLAAELNVPVRFVIFHLGPVNGIKLNIDYFLLFLQTGEGNL